MNSFDPTYLKTFLRHASNVRFYKETIALPIRLQPIQVNRTEEIEAGHKLDHAFWRDGYGSLEYLSAPGQGKNSHRLYNRLLCNLERREGLAVDVHWYLTCYDSTMSFVMFDIDRHYPADATQSEKDAIDRDAQKQVDAIEDMEFHTGCSVVWTTSPGGGLYAYVPIDREVVNPRLKAAVTHLKSFYGIDCEANDTLTSFRLPGFRYVELVDPRSYQLLQPLNPNDPPELTMIRFQEAWKNAKPISPAKLFNQAIRASKRKPVVKTRKSSVQQVTVEAALYMRCTFKAATERKICSIAVHRAKRLGASFSSALEEVVTELPKIRGVSKTCSDPRKLVSTCKGWLSWYWAKFDPSKCNSGRDAQDQERIAESASLDAKWLFKLLAPYKLTPSELDGIGKFFNHLKGWNGRVGYKELYACFGSQRKAFRVIREKLRGEVIVIYDEYVKGVKCRQWGFHKSVIRKVKEAPKAVKWYQKYGKQIEAKIRKASPLNSKAEYLERVANHYLLLHASQPQVVTAFDSAPLFYELVSPLGSSESYDWDKLLGKTAA
jgi:hypothetical protein